MIRTGNLLAAFLAGALLVLTACNEVFPPPDLVVEATGVTTIVDLGEARAFDENGNPVTPVVPLNAEPFPLGQRFVWWVTQENGEITGGAKQVVTVRDTTPPAVSAPGVRIVRDASGEPVAVDIGAATATDIFPVGPVTSDAPDRFPPGTTTVTWSATDANGNTGRATQQVTVTAPEPPDAQADNEFDPYRVSVSGGAGSYYRVTGLSGSVGGAMTVSILHVPSGLETLALAGPDGGFSAGVQAAPGDRLELTASGNGLGPGPTLVRHAGGLVIKNTYGRDGFWYLGQTHVHSDNSDGRDPPQSVEAAYHDAGYDFVVSTDHRGTSPLFGAKDDGMTADPDNSATGKDLLWIRGSELGFGKVHMGAWGQDRRTVVAGSNENIQDIQAKVDEVRGNGGIVVANHPGNEKPPWAWNWHDELARVRRVSMVEAFNGKHEDELSEHISFAVDMADEFRQVWWTGTDDCHDIGDPARFDVYAIVVQTDGPEPEQAALIRSTDSGRFYVRENADGPVIENVLVDGNRVTVRLADIDSDYRVTWKKRGNEVAGIEESVDTTASYTVRGDEGYVRAEVERKDSSLHAYTQPLFIADPEDLATGIGSSTGFDAGALVDDDRHTYWKAGSQTGYVTIDTGAVQTLNAIRIDWRDADGGRFNYRIETSPTGAFAGEQTRAVRETWDNRLAQTLDFFDEYARYVRVVVTGESSGGAMEAQIREIEVYRSAPAPTEYYVDGLGGNDANSGLAGSPKQTFDGFRTLLRPRDRVNFLNASASGGIRLGRRESGKNPDARVVVRGSPFALIDARGGDYGVRLEAGATYIDVESLVLYGARTSNVLIEKDVADVTVRRNILFASAGRGFNGAGDFAFTDNLVFDNAGHGVFVYQDGTRGLIAGNTIVRNGADGIVLGDHWETSADVFNNVISGNTGNALSRGDLGIVVDGFNCIDGPVRGGWSLADSTIGDPLLVAPESNNFRLQTGSPCIDAGLDLGLDGDLYGQSAVDDPATPNTGSRGSFDVDYRDIGALEY